MVNNMLKERLKKLSIQNKFFFSMFLSSTMIFLLLFLANNLVFLTYFTQSETRASANELDSISQQLDFFLTSVENYSNTIKLDEDIQEVCHAYNRQKDHFTYNLTGSAKDRLYAIIQSTRFIYSVSIYGTDNRLLISTEAVPRNDLPDLAAEISGPTWRSTQKNSRTNPSESLHTLSYFCDFYSYSTGEMLGYIEIAIPESAISSTYQTHLSSTTKILIVNHQGNIESDTDVNKIGSPYLQLDFTGEQQPFTRAFFSQAVVFSHYYERLDWYIIKEVKYYSFISSLGSALLISLLISALCLLLYWFLAQKISSTITTPLHKLILHTKKISRGQWGTINPQIANDQDTLILLNSFNSMLLTQEELKNELLTAQNEKAKLSLDLLQEQINPHFLYNTLENICALAELGENQILIEIVMNLSAFYRGCLSDGKLFVSIAEELEITRAFLTIMQIRYGNTFDFRIHCEESLLNCQCLKLLLQPLVENSIEHGISAITFRGKIEITVKSQDQWIYITVSDNGVGISPQKLKGLREPLDKHFGIYNVRRRIELYYGDESAVELENLSEGGFKVTLKVKKEVQKDA